MSGPGPAVVVRLFNGLGNQLFQYAAARAMGIRLGVPVRGDTTGFARVRDRAGHEARHELPRLGLVLPPASAEEVSAANPTWWRRIRAGRRTAIPVLAQRAGEMPRIAWQAARAPVYLDGYWQGEEFFREAREEIGAHLGALQPSATAAPWVQALRADGVVAVMVRRGDYVTSVSTRRVLGLLPPEYFSRGIETLRSDGTVRSAVVFSDDVEWCEHCLRLPVPHVVCRLADPVEKWLVATQARAFVIGNSTYAWWAAWVAGRRGARTVMPARWFADPGHRAWGEAMRVPEWRTV